MEDILVSDYELIYLIRQNNEEAKRLLFLRYETFKRKILEKTDYSLHRNLDDNAIDSIYYESIMEAISNYEYEKGYFFFFVKEVFEKKQSIATGYFEVKYYDGYEDDGWYCPEITLNVIFYGTTHQVDTKDRDYLIPKDDQIYNNAG